MLPVSMLVATIAFGGVSARWSFEDAYPQVAEGDWYIGENNESATLAWGESYVMMSLAAMFRATGHRMYLDRLAEHLDALLQQRDDVRGVADYRGISGACWRNTSYQDGGEPYCYAVHSGMLIYPMVEYARLVDGQPWADEPSPDGESYADKAAAYVVAAEETVAFHEDEWNPAGYYFARADATFLSFVGEDLPLNQSNALGRALVALAQVTGDPAHLQKATALAQRLRDQMTVAADGAYLWNYWGGPLAGNGEDISHAAINVDFAADAAAAGIVFDDADLDGLAATFLQRVYVNDGTFSDFVGGGTTNDGGYRPQVGRWLDLSRRRTAVYTAVRDLYEADYPPESVGSGSILLGWALLAEHEPLHCAPFFYSVDWEDQGDVREATAYGANILTVPPDLAEPCIVPTTIDAPRAVEVQQYDGDAYHRVASFRATGGMADRFVAYEPRWPFPYADDGVLYQFDDAFVAGSGIVVAEHPGLTAPQITTTPPRTVELASALQYDPDGTGDGAWWWALPIAPPSATIDPATGVIAWTPDAPGGYDFELRLQTDVGEAVQAFTVFVEDVASEATGDETPCPDATGDPEGDTAPGATDGAGDGTDAATAGDDGTGAAGGRGDGESGCACRQVPAAGSSSLLALIVIGATRRRARSRAAWTRSVCAGRSR
jgi:hypothetical protein